MILVGPVNKVFEFGAHASVSVAQNIWEFLKFVVSKGVVNLERNEKT